MGGVVHPHIEWVGLRGQLGFREKRNLRKIRPPQRGTFSSLSEWTVPMALGLHRLWLAGHTQAFQSGPYQARIQHQTQLA